MEKFERTLKKRRTLLQVVFLAVVLLTIYDRFFARPEIKENIINAFQLGIISAGGLIAIMQVYLISAALRDPQKLKLRYNQENDERLKTIRSKAGIPVLIYSSVAMIFAGTIAGYFNTTVFITLIICAVCQMMFSLALKLIYFRKM